MGAAESNSKYSDVNEEATQLFNSWREDTIGGKKDDPVKGPFKIVEHIRGFSKPSPPVVPMGTRVDPESIGSDGQPRCALHIEEMHSRRCLYLRESAQNVSIASAVRQLKSEFCSEPKKIALYFDWPSRAKDPLESDGEFRQAMMLCATTGRKMAHIWLSRNADDTNWELRIRPDAGFWNFPESTSTSIIIHPDICQSMFTHVGLGCCAKFWAEGPFYWDTRSLESTYPKELSPYVSKEDFGACIRLINRALSTQNTHDIAAAGQDTQLLYIAVIRKTLKAMNTKFPKIEWIFHVHKMCVGLSASSGDNPKFYNSRLHHLEVRVRGQPKPSLNLKGSSNGAVTSGTNSGSSTLVRFTQTKNHADGVVEQEIG